MKRERARRAIKPALLAGLGLILYVIAATSGTGWLYVISAAVLAVIVVSAAGLLWSVRGLEVSREAPPTGRAGDPLECTLKVRNTGRLARYALEIEDELAGGTGRGALAQVKPGETAALRYSVRNPWRGVYSGGEVTVESAAPFGLFYGRRRVRAESGGTVVHPRTFDVAGLPSPSAGDAEKEREESAALQRGEGEEFWGVREYRPGDPARLIAWGRSARSISGGQLAVVEHARQTAPPITVAMSLNHRAPREAREMVVSAGASLLLGALLGGREVAAEAGVQNAPFPDAPDPESVLNWCAELVASHPPPMEGPDVAILPSLREAREAVAGGAGTVALVSCHAFAGPGRWMTPEEEREFLAEIEAAGGRALSLGAEEPEPWRVA